MKIIGIKDMSLDQVKNEIDNGGRFISFNYCISLLVVSLKRSSNIYFIRSNEKTINKSIIFTWITLFLGWWGIPWGPIYSIQSIFKNLKGGVDVTQNVMDSISQRANDGTSK